MIAPPEKLQTLQNVLQCTSKAQTLLYPQKTGPGLGYVLGEILDGVGLFKCCGTEVKRRNLEEAKNV